MPDTSAASHRHRLAVVGAVCMLLLGLVGAIVGPALPALRSAYGLDATKASFLISSFSVGTVGGVLGAGVLLHRVTPRLILGAGVAAIGLGALAVAAAGTPALAGLGLVLVGLGFGVLDIAINLLIARAYGSSGGAALAVVTSSFGVGAIVGPLVVGRTPADAGPPFLFAGICALVLLPLTLTVRASATPKGEHREGGRSLLGLLVGFGLLLVAYVAIETGAGSWETTHLKDGVHLGAGQAANATSLFFVGLTVGRLVSAPIALRITAAQLIVGSMTLASLSMIVAVHGPWAVAAYAATGFFLAPVFPAIIAWHAHTVPSGRGATPVFAAGLAGPILAAPLLGASADRFGANSIPLVLTGIAVATLVGAVLLAARVRAHLRHSPAPLSATG